MCRDCRKKQHTDHTPTITCSATKNVPSMMCNSLDSTLRTALASFYVSDTESIRFGGILSVMAMFR